MLKTQEKFTLFAGIRLHRLFKRCLAFCLKVSPSHLSQIRDEFEGMYYEQNTYLNSMANATVTSSGKRIGRPLTEDSSFMCKSCLRNEKNIHELINAILAIP